MIYHASLGFLIVLGGAADDEPDGFPHGQRTSEFTQWGKMMFRKTTLALGAAAFLAFSASASAAIGPQTTETAYVPALERVSLHTPADLAGRLTRDDRAAAPIQVAGARFNCCCDRMNAYNSTAAGFIGNLVFGLPISMAVYYGC